MSVIFQVVSLSCQEAKMTIDRWIQEYKPVQHPTGDEHGFEVDGKSCLIETYEGNVLERLPHNKLWTLVENDEGDMIILAGLHRVNAVGYLQTEEPWETGDETTHPDPEDDDVDEDDWEMDDKDDQD